MDINDIVKKLSLKYSKNMYSPHFSNQKIGIFELADKKFHMILGYSNDIESDKTKYFNLGTLDSFGKEYVNEDKDINLSSKEVREIHRNFISVIVKYIESANVEELTLLNGDTITKDNPNFNNIVRKPSKNLLNSFYRENKDILKFEPSTEFHQIINADEPVIISEDMKVPSNEDGVLIKDTYITEQNKQRLYTESRARENLFKNLEENVYPPKDIPLTTNHKYKKNIDNSKSI